MPVHKSMSGGYPVGPVIHTKASSCWCTVMLVPGHSGKANDWMLEALAEELRQQGIQVLRFNFRYVRQRLKGGPFSLWPDDTQDAQVLEFRQQILRYHHQQRAAGQDLPLIIGGYSRGGLIATLAAEASASLGSFALGFPFHPPGDLTSWRSGHLAITNKPVLIINGDQDPYGSPDEVNNIALSANVALHWLKGRNHAMTFTHPQGQEPIHSIREMAALIQQFCKQTKDQDDTA